MLEAGLTLRRGAIGSRSERSGVVQSDRESFGRLEDDLSTQKELETAIKSE